MRAGQFAEQWPTVAPDADALEVARLLAEGRLPGVVVLDSPGSPTVVAAWQMVRALVPAYVREMPLLAGVLDEHMWDRAADRLRGKKIRDVVAALPDPPVVHGDDTLAVVAEVMARTRSPLVAVVADGSLIGVVTCSRLLGVAVGI
ncbi:CBS domain-containing protein [Nocardia crassostreae]|uniref:CBS domain-containing protein n=1 Tax=Nocardia crassostreae TaxID=53428 RepID=UPI00082CC5F5|nr:CBS domain-containing protein [Nocardia crassostreae]